MITIRTMKQIATSRSIPGFRAARSLNQQSAPLEQGRLAAGYGQMLNQEARRQWCKQMWQNRSVRRAP